MTQLNDQWFMQVALEEAEKAFRIGEVPIGAVIVDNKSAQIIAKSHNLKEGSNHAHKHAELLAMKYAATQVKDWRLVDHTLYTTLEPCIMCAATMLQYRINRVVFGAYDAKGGAYSLGYHFGIDKRLNHQFSIEGGVCHYDCSQILSQFFKQRRGGHKI